MATQLQKNLAKNIVRNAVAKHPKTKKELVVSSGYDETTAIKQVPAVFEQKGVKEELVKLGYVDKFKQEIPDEELIIVHKQGLHAYRVHSSMTEPDQVVEDFQTRHKYLDLAYKLRGDLAPEKHINLNMELRAILPQEKIDEINQIALDDE